MARKTSIKDQLRACDDRSRHYDGEAFTIPSLVGEPWEHEI